MMTTLGKLVTKSNKNQQNQQNQQNGAYIIISTAKQWFLLNCERNSVTLSLLWGLPASMSLWPRVFNKLIQYLWFNINLSKYSTD